MIIAYQSKEIQQTKVQKVFDKVTTSNTPVLIYDLAGDFNVIELVQKIQDFYKDLADEKLAQIHYVEVQDINELISDIDSIDLESAFVVINQLNQNFYKHRISDSNVKLCSFVKLFVLLRRLSSHDDAVQRCSGVWMFDSETTAVIGTPFFDGVDVT